MRDNIYRMKVLIDVLADKGDPIEVELSNSDLCCLKAGVPEAILVACKNAKSSCGKALVETHITLNGEYVDSDETLVWIKEDFSVLCCIDPMLDEEKLEYQIYDRKTGELIAWLCPHSGQHIVHKNYDIKIGNNLLAQEVEEAVDMKAVAKFEKVKYSQWVLDTDKELHGCYDSIQCPVRKTAGSAGYDFLAPHDIVIKPHETVKLATGIKCQIDEGFVLELYPRSSLGFKYRLTLDNTVGIIDADYYNNENNEGHIQCKMTNNSDKEIFIKAGEGYMQGLFKEFFITKDDHATAKRTGGIGSTNS